MLFQVGMEFQQDGRPQNKGEFVLGLTLPDQALTNDSYKNKNNVNWKKVDCPIVYTLQRDPSYMGRGGSINFTGTVLN